MKKLLILLTVLALVLSLPFSANAEGGTVTYEKDAGDFVFAPGSEHSLTDLFTEFKDVMPGDTLKQKITVKNDASKKVKVNIYIRSLGAHKDSKDFLSKLKLRVNLSEDNGMGYMFDSTADSKGQLEDWMCLGTLYSGGEVNLDVMLDVPVELDNTYKNQIGLLDWEFKVEEFNIEPTDPKPPQTGDDSGLVLSAAVAMISVMAIFILVLTKRKNKQNETA